MQESKGFKGDIGKSKQANKLRKQDARTAKERRERKLQDLVSSPRKWKNLESFDVRTPTKYFQNRGASPEALNKLKGKLDDLLSSLYEYKERVDATPAEEEILDNEIYKAERKRYRKVSKENASRVMEALVHGTSDEAMEAIREAIDYKVFCRVEPFMEKTGEEMEEQIFWCNQYGNK